MLLDHGKEVLRGFSGRENHGLTAEGTHLGTANGENVAELGQVLDGNIAGGAHEAIAQTGTVYKQRQMILFTDCVDGRKLSLGIERTIFRREGNVHHAGEDHVVVGAVGVIPLQIT